MPSTIGWLALAIAAGALTGIAIGHLTTVVGWLRRCLEDPVARPHVAIGDPAQDTPGRRTF